ncbi:DUF11 domain-containing protein [Fibrella sp. USSR17]
MKITTYPLLRHYCLLLLGLLSSCSTALAAPPSPPAPAAGPTPPGNYVFRDDNQNNIFDAAEVGIPNVRVNLFTSDGVLRETTLTTATGLFSFTSTIQPNTSYDVRINAADAPANRKLVLANQGSDELADSDASLIGSTAVIVVQSSAGGLLPNNLGFGYAAGDPDLVLTKASNSFSVTQGSTATFTLSLSNVGGSTATGVVIRDTLDAGMHYVSSTPAATTALLGSGQVQVTWSPGTLLADASASYQVTVRAVANGVLTNVAGVTATSADGTPRNNLARACFTVPVKLCQGDAYVTSLTTDLQNVEWFRDGVSVGTGNSLTIVTAGTYSYTSITVGTNCQAGSCCPIIIYNGSVPNLTIARSVTALCVGESASLTANNCVGSLTWNTGSTQATISVSPIVTTSYSFTCIPSAADACSASATATITVNPSVTATLSSATICNTTTATLLATGGTSYRFNDGTINATGRLVISPEATTTYSVTVTNAFGCSAIASGTVTVNPAVTATVADQVICFSTTATLSATAAGGTGLTYTWLPAGTGSTASVTVSPTLSTLYTVIVTNSDGCSTTATATVTVNPATSATIGIAPSQTICEGNTVVLTAAGTGGASYNYLWSTNATSQAISVSPTTTTVYSVTVSNADTGCPAVATTTITVNPTPVLTVNSETICQEATTLLSLTGCAGTVTWSTGTTGSTLEVTPLQTTVYSATCVLSTGCSATVATTVTVTPTPSVQTQNVVATRATCNGATANNDASIALTGLSNTVRVSISAADGTTLPDFATAVAVTNGTYTFTNLPNPTQWVTYLVRLYGADGICTSTLTVALDPAACVCPVPACIPIVVRRIN